MSEDRFMHPISQDANYQQYKLLLNNEYMVIDISCTMFMHNKTLAYEAGL